MVWQAVVVAFVDLPGFIADLKEHAIEHGFHVHDERHFVETYSLRQTWEVDLHPEEACGGPLDLHLALEADPRVTLTFEDAMNSLPEGDLPDDTFHLPLVFSWAMPPMKTGPDLLVLATDLAGVAGPDLPLQVSAIDGVVDVVDAPERTLAISARVELSLRSLFTGEQSLCDVLDRSKEVSEYLLDHAEDWIGEWPEETDD